MHVAVVAEMLGVESGCEDGLVAPVADASPERYADLVPRVGQHLGFALGPVNREEVSRHVVGIDFADRDDDLACLDIELAAPEGLVNPELLKRYLTAALGLGLVFSALIGVDFHGALGASMLKLDFHSHGPTTAKIVAEVKGDMGKVKAAVAVVIPVGGGVAIAVEVLAVEVARSDGLAIAADGEARQRIGDFLDGGIVAPAVCG